MDLSFDAPPRGTITSGFLSKHIGANRDFNEQNDGLGYINPLGYLLGAYKNSLGKTSVYAGKEFKTNLLGNEKIGLDGGLVAGGVTGYNKSLLPLILPELIARYGENALALLMVPKTQETPLTLALQYRKKF